MDSCELRNMFANLLANSMNQDTKSKVHPSYVEIIKQLSPLDATNIKYISDSIQAPIVNIIKIKNATLGLTSDMYNNFFLNDTDINDIDANTVSISNLNRLGLITIDYLHSIEHEYDDGISSFIEPYTKFVTHELFTSMPRYQQKFDSFYGYTDRIDIQRGQVFLTPLGKSFFNICIKNE